VQVFVACLFVTYAGLFCTLTLAVSMDVFPDAEMRHIEIDGRHVDVKSHFYEQKRTHFYVKKGLISGYTNASHRNRRTHFFAFHLQGGEDP